MKTALFFSSLKELHQQGNKFYRSYWRVYKLIRYKVYLNHLCFIWIIIIIHCLYYYRQFASMSLSMFTWIGRFLLNDLQGLLLTNLFHVFLFVLKGEQKLPLLVNKTSVISIYSIIFIWRSFFKQSKVYTMSKCPGKLRLGSFPGL